ELGVDVNAKDSRRWTLLHSNVQIKDIEITKPLVGELGADVNAKDNNGWTPLFICTQNGHVELANLLLKFGADVNIKFKFPDINAKDTIGWTLLHNAMNQKDIEMAKILMCELGANVNAKDNGGWTPLHHCALSGHINMVKLLIGEGAKFQASYMLVRGTIGGQHSFKERAEKRQGGLHVCTHDHATGTSKRFLNSTLPAATHQDTYELTASRGSANLNSNPSLLLLLTLPKPAAKNPRWLCWTARSRARFQPDGVSRDPNELNADSSVFSPCSRPVNPQFGWMAKGIDSETLFDDIDLSEGEWAEYDEKSQLPVSISNVKATFKRI
ncbi:ankyrin repeat-containing domain protein, partial [Endogone sp. FLAS-F59071]